MHSPLQQQLIEESCHVIALARPLIERIEKRDRDLASQLRRSLSGITLCIAEGFGRRAGNARNLFETARGSLLESHAAFGVAIAWSYLSETNCAEVRQRLDRLSGRLFGLMRR